MARHVYREAGGLKRLCMAGGVAFNSVANGRIPKEAPFEEIYIQPCYYSLIRRFGEATGVPVVLNTSFNLRGEPIVASPWDAWKSFMKSEMDTLVLENFLIEKNRVLHATC